MAYWIFQSDPKTYDIHGALDESDQFLWVTRQHSNEIHIGDAVLIWCAGDGAGIYALGQVTSEPQVLACPDDPHWVESDEGSTPELRVRVAVTQRFEPILREDIKDDPTMRESQIIKARVGTNFKVTPEQWHSLVGRLDN